MPLHDYECLMCQHKEEHFVKIADLGNTVFQCEFCGGTMRRLMSATYVQMDYPGYSCPITGKWIEGKKAHKENLERHGCRVLETGEREQFAKRKARESEEFDDKIVDASVDVLLSMPKEKQDRIAGELVRGAEAPIIRL